MDKIKYFIYLRRKNDRLIEYEFFDVVTPFVKSYDNYIRFCIKINKQDCLKSIDNNSVFLFCKIDEKNQPITDSIGLDSKILSNKYGKIGGDTTWITKISDFYEKENYDREEKIKYLEEKEKYVEETSSQLFKDLLNQDCIDKIKNELTQIFLNTNFQNWFKKIDEYNIKEQQIGYEKEREKYANKEVADAMSDANSLSYDDISGDPDLVEWYQDNNRSDYSSSDENEDISISSWEEGIDEGLWSNFEGYLECLESDEERKIAIKEEEKRQKKIKQEIDEGNKLHKGDEICGIYNYYVFSIDDIDDPEKCALKTNNIKQLFN